MAEGDSADGRGEDAASQWSGLRTRAEAGDLDARNALFASLYDELHRLAQAHVHRSAGPLTLSATTLLHEAYLNIVGRNALAFPDRNRFLGYASKAMRGLIIQYVRHRTAEKRGGGLTFRSLTDAEAAPSPTVDLERLDAALDELSSIDPLLMELVDLKFFCGFTFSEIAAMRHVSERTVQRDWAKARTLLHLAMADE